MYFVIASLIGLIGGSTNFFLWFDILIPPFGNIGLSLFALILTYAISKRDLLDIQLIIPNGVAGIISFGTIVLSYFLVLSINIQSSVLTHVAFGTLTIFWGLFGGWLRAQLRTGIAHKFIKDNYNSETLLRIITEELIPFEDKRVVLEFVALDLHQHIQVTSIHAILKESAENLSPNYHLITLKNEDENKHELPNISKILNHFNNCKPEIGFPDHLLHVTLLDDLPSTVQNEFKEYGISTPAIILPFYSQFTFHGLLILGPKASKKPFGKKDFNFFEALAHHISVIFDRIDQQNHLVSLNETISKSRDEVVALNTQLATLNQHLENRVKEEVSKKTQALQAAQEMSRHVAFAQLTKGIAHEIRNPMSSIKNGVGMVMDDLQNNAFVFRWPQDNTWIGIVSIGDLEKITGYPDKAQAAFDMLVRRGIIDSEGQLDMDHFSPESVTYYFEVDDAFSNNADILENYLKTVYIKKHLWRTLRMVYENTERTIRISDEMLKYGKSGKGITPATFSEFLTPQQAKALWTELVKNNYIDANGFVEPKFNSSNPNFKLIVSEPFQSVKDAIQTSIAQHKTAFKEQLSVSELIEAAFTITAGDFRGAGIRCDKTLTDDADIICNRDQLMGVLLNLFKNSLDAMATTPSGQRKFTVSTQKSPFQNMHNDTLPGIKISISDTGCGIPSENLSKIREPFFSTKSVTGGTNIGLGLALVFQTVEGHNGKVTVESIEGKGTTFHLFFPTITPPIQ